MAKVKQILCIHPEPVELSINALLNRQGIVVDLTAVSSSESFRIALEQPLRWDLFLRDAVTYYDLEVTGSLHPVNDLLDVLLVLLKSLNLQLSPSEDCRRGAADVLLRVDLDHLLMVCERELKNCALRKQPRHSLQAKRHGLLVEDARLEAGAQRIESGVASERRGSKAYPERKAVQSWLF